LRAIRWARRDQVAYFGEHSIGHTSGTTGVVVDSAAGAILSADDEHTTACPALDPRREPTDETAIVELGREVATPNAKALNGTIAASHWHELAPAVAVAHERNTISQSARRSQGLRTWEDRGLMPDGRRAVKGLGIPMHESPAPE
jgi:hypothetical protein